MLEISAATRRVARHVVVGSDGARRYLSPDFTLPEFFEALNERGVSYAVLRWFEDLPHVAPGEDVDILVADEDLAFVNTLLLSRPLRWGTQKFDVYTVGGLPGTDFAGVPYYAPRFARALLADAVLHKALYRVPSPEHHFQSLAYHAVYHKGLASGLQDGTNPSEVPQPSDHDYAAVLAELGRRLGESVSPTLDALDGYLAEHGLRPPLDTLERLEPRNPWIREHFLSKQSAVEPVWQGLAVFVLRDLAAGAVDVALGELDQQGFEVLDVLQLDAEQREAASHRLRGGNWERGPWPVSGGAPHSYVVAYDVAARVRPDDGTLTNQRIPEAKAAVRLAILRGVAADERFNPVHSSDNPAQALDYLEALGDLEVEARLRARAAALVEACAFPFPVVQHLDSYARRARAAIVKHPEHGTVVCKVFRPGAARFLEREVRGRLELADLPQVPALLDRGEGWMITPFYGDDRSHVQRQLAVQSEVQLRPQAARELAGFARALHERGHFLLDLSSQNLVSDPAEGLKVLDLEFLQEYAEPRPGLRGSFTFRGVPEGADRYDVPMPTVLSARGEASMFQPAVTGLRIEDLLAPARPGEGVRRSAVQLAWHVYYLVRARHHGVRSWLQASGWSRRLGKARRLVLTAGRTAS